MIAISRGLALCLSLLPMKLSRLPLSSAVRLNDDCDTVYLPKSKPHIPEPALRSARLFVFYLNKSET
jgi:hypothetical protein